MDNSITDFFNWNLFPSDLLSYLFTFITDVSDIITFMLVSKAFRNNAKLYVTKLSSSKLVSIQLTNLKGFDKLVRSNENILLEINDIKDISVIGLMKDLVETNFYFSVKSEIKFSDMVLEIMDTYLMPIKEEYKTGGEKIHQRSLDNGMIRIIAILPEEYIETYIIDNMTSPKQKVYTLIIDHGKILIITPNTIRMETLKGKIENKYNPKIIEFLRIDGEPPHQTNGYDSIGLKENMINFINYGEFGLLDPSKPVSETNPTLKSQLKTINTDFSNIMSLQILLGIYIYTNIEEARNDFFKADEKIRESFEKIVKKYNKNNDFHYIFSNISLDKIKFKDLSIFASRSKIIKQSRTLTFIKFISRVRYFNPKDLKIDFNTILITSNIVEDLRKNNQPIYLPDGSIKFVNNN